MSDLLDSSSLLQSAGLRNPPAAFYPGSHLIEVWAEEPDRPIGSFAFLIHERIHYLQSIGTPFGIYYMDSFNYRASAITTACSKVALDLGMLRFPLRLWRDQRKQEFGDSDDLTTRRLNRAIFYADRLDNALGRFLGFDARYDTADPHLQGVPLSGSHYASIHRPRAGIHSTVETKYGQAAVSGVALMESFALYWQVYAEHFLPEGRPYQHAVLLDLIDRLGQLKPWAYARYASLIEHTVNCLDVDHLWMFPILADLALSGPMPAVDEAAEQEFVGLVRNQGTGQLERLRLGGPPVWSWEEIHPGWRFYRAVDALPGSGLLDRYRGSEQDWVQAYREITSWLCKHLSWETPDVVAGKWIQAAAEKPMPPATMPIIREKRLAAMRVRSRRPGLFAFPGYFLDELDDHITPPVFVWGALPTPTGNVVHVAREELGMFFYVHMLNRWAEMFLPSLTLSIAPSARSSDHACPFASDNYRSVCTFKEKQFCEVGKFPNLDCFYRKEFRLQFGIELEELKLYPTNDTLQDTRSG